MQPQRCEVDQRVVAGRLGLRSAAVAVNMLAVRLRLMRVEAYRLAAMRLSVESHCEVDKLASRCC